MKVVITGATGFIGRRLSRSLITGGHQVLALTRDESRAAPLLDFGVQIVEWQQGDQNWEREVAGADAVVNLAGANLSSGRWSKQKKRLLLESRLAAIRSIARAVTGVGARTQVILQASAVGYYGPRGDDNLSEEATSGDGYLAQIARECEREAESLIREGLRVVSIRTGIVLGREAGILPRLFTPLRLGFGGYPGSGQQWLSWIHIDDEVSAIEFLLEHGNLSGAFNLTAPEPLRMRDFVKLGGSLLHRPVWVPLPPILLRVIFGEMADEALLTGQRVVPKRLEGAGFTFRHRDARSALTELYSRTPGEGKSA